MIRERSQIADEDKWNVEAFYASFEAWEEDFNATAREGHTPRFPTLAAFKGTLSQSPHHLAAFLHLYLALERHLSKLFTYAHLRHDEEVSNERHKQGYVKITSLLYEFRAESSWVEPEILEIANYTEFLASKDLEAYRLYLERIFRLKPHTLSADKEQLVALAGKALDTAAKAFSAFNNADLKFPPVKDGKGELRELTHGKYLAYLKDKDRVLREHAFKTMHRSYSNYENTLCELIAGEVQRHVFDMRSRNYRSCLETALFPHHIDLNVYTSLIQTVRKHIGSLHRYMELKKKILKLDTLHVYDQYAPLVEQVDLSMGYKQAEALVIDSVAVLGQDYQNALKKGLMQERWVDRYENARKRSGAYSSGCYDSMPYILMNYQGTFGDVMTLSHEAGHSMHSYLSKRHQPYHYSQYVIFVAEVASTFHEELLLRHLLSQVTDKAKKAYLIHQKLEDMRATLLRQTLFAEFELKLHEWAEQEVPLTPLLLKTEYRKLNAEYFGPGVVLDEELDIEWARIPHFYYNFYVYQYATGISAAHALVDLVCEGGEAERQRYVHFLSSGCSRFPLDLLADAGVDMRTGRALEAAMRHFDALVTELQKILD